VTFDLWQTLIFDEPDDEKLRGRMRCEALQKVLSGQGLAVPLDDLLEAHEKSARQLQALWSRNECVSTMDQIRLIVQLASENTLDIALHPRAVEMLQKAYIDPLFVFPPILKEDALDTLAGTRQRVRKIGLISNTGRSPGVALRQVLDNFGILKFFDATVFSDEAGCRKPDKRIFGLALRELGSQSSDTIHVGNNPEADVWGAKQAGMRAVLLDYPVPEELKREPGSLFALSRSYRHVPDSEIKADARITSLKEFLDFMDTLV
jgi:FMN phosphatase YigB (HAD superfamily)